MTIPHLRVRLIDMLTLSLRGLGASAPRVAAIAEPENVVGKFRLQVGAKLN